VRLLSGLLLFLSPFMVITCWQPHPLWISHHAGVVYHWPDAFTYSRAATLPLFIPPT
jgi:hypothetical protein